MNPGISVGHIYSLRGLLLGYNLAFLLLVIITGALGWTGVELRQQIADEADRVSTLLNLAQETRGDVYQQMTEVFDHHFLAEPLAVLRYRSTSQRIEARFLRLDQTALHPVEKEAIEAMLLAYEQVRLQTDEIMSVPSNAIREEGHLTVFFTADLEMAWLDSYEHVFAANDSLMRLTQRGEDEAESALSQNTRMILFLPVALAALMLLASRAFLNRALVRPVAEILRGFSALGSGELDYKVPVRGAAELVALEKAVNRMARDLAESREALVRSEKQAALGALVPVVAHNIRNPLASIRATAQVHDNGDAPKEVIKALRDIRDTVDRLERWLSALLTYLNPVRLSRTPASLGDVVSEGLRLLAPRLKAKKLVVEKNGWDSPPVVLVDVHLLEQAIYGLLLNALEASPEGSKITLGLGRESGWAVLHIRDHGPGMPFRPLPENLNPGPTTKSFGSGLGIPFAFKVCDMHDGAVEFRSPSSGGTEVVVTLPTEEASRSAA